MNEIVQFIIHHGPVLIFATVFAEQIGLPVPAAPLLLVIGAVAGQGLFNLPLAILVALIACLLGDVIWYLIGRHRGGSVLSLLCHISLNPDSCVRRTLNLFSLHGAKSLLVAKFFPGISTIAPPFAGIFHMKFSRFLLFDGLGAAIWVGSFVGLGILFSDQIEKITASASRLGAAFLGVVIAALTAYIGLKYLQRHRFLARLRIARITPEELKERVDAGEDLVILDVRHFAELEADPQTIPGALYLPLEKLEKESLTIPGDREVILYCN